MKLLAPGRLAQSVTVHLDVCTTELYVNRSIIRYGAAPPDRNRPDTGYQ